MKKLVFFLGLFLLFFIGCDKGCLDSKACNYGVTTEECKYPYQEESLLIGLWNLVDIHDPYGNCLFTFSSDWDCELDEMFNSISIGFNDDKTCLISTDPSEFSDPIPIGGWSINICENMLIFSHVSEGYDLYIYPNYFPIGNQKIIQLSWDTFLCKDLAGNTLRWEKI